MADKDRSRGLSDLRFMMNYDRASGGGASREQYRQLDRIAGDREDYLRGSGLRGKSRNGSRAKMRRDSRD